MPTSSDSFDELLARFQAGDRDAAAEVFRRFSHRLIGLARTRLDGRMKAKIDPEDVMQSVFKSFCGRQAEQPFELDSWDSLWSLLTVLTLRKCGYQTRYFLAQRRDLRREAAPRISDDDSKSSWQAVGREPTPADAAALSDAVESLLADLEPRDREIVEASLQGDSADVIADRVGCSERTVQRLLARIRGKLQKLADDDDIAEVATS